MTSSREETPGPLHEVQIGGFWIAAAKQGDPKPKK